MDKIEKHIIKELGRDARKSFNKMAKELGIAPETVKRRYQKLRKGVICKFFLNLNLKKIGYQRVVIANIKTTPQYPETMIKEIERIPDVVAAIKTMGEYNFIVLAAGGNLDQLLRLSNNLKKLKFVTQVDISVSHSESFDPQ